MSPLSPWLRCNLRGDRALTIRGGVLVAHPEIQHSGQLAAALASKGLLREYVNGVPLERVLMETVGRNRHACWPVFRWVRRLLSRVPNQVVSNESIYRLYRTFDRLVASRYLARIRPDLVIAYENSALATFEMAKQLGVPRVLDAAALHHSWETRWLQPSVSPDFQREVNARKDREVELADLILVCSTLARDSYVAAGVDQSRIKVAPLGADLECFSSKDPLLVRKGVHFVFAGRLNRLKGADLLLEACRRLHASGRGFELTIACSHAGADPILLEGFRRFAKLPGQLPHKALAQLYRDADCLVVPSRFDSFAMVVPEAMASGLPVILSSNVGARDLVTEGQNGWIIPPADAGALYAAMARCVDDPTTCRAMSSAARTAAEGASWFVYRETVTGIISNFMKDMH